MAWLEFNNVKIAGVAACVPKNVNRNENLTNLISQEEVEKTIKSIGIVEKRFVDQDVTSSDLCFKAAEELLTKMNIDRNSIDVLIFMSQTPDYVTPATSAILQDRLGLSKDTACFDMNLACSGYVYALSNSFAYASQLHINRVLLLNGETFSKIVSEKDKVNAPLYGDAGTATLIEKSDCGLKSYFSLHTDGSGHKAVMVPAGGYRNMASASTLEEREREDGNYRTDHQMYMNGVDVFNFTMLRVPKSVNALLRKIEMDLSDLDKIVFHQANKFMTDFFAKKLKFPLEKVPYCLHKYGNTSSCSIPLTISSELESNNNLGKVVLSGFGGGLSWGTAFVSLNECAIINVVEY